MIMRIIGSIVGFLLSLVLIALELIMHLFLGVQMLLQSNSAAVIEGYLNTLASYMNSTFFTDYHGLLLKPIPRFFVYFLVFLIIILIVVFNKRFSLSFKEVGLATFIAAIPLLLLSFGLISMRGIIPETSMDQYLKFFESAFRTPSLIALAIGAGLYLIGVVIREIERKIRAKKKQEEKERKQAEKEQRHEERKNQLKNLFGHDEETETQPAEQPEDKVAAEETQTETEEQQAEREQASEEATENEESEQEEYMPVEEAEQVDDTDEQEEKTRKKSLLENIFTFKYGEKESDE